MKVESIRKKLPPEYQVRYLIELTEGEAKALKNESQAIHCPVLHNLVSSLSFAGAMYPREVDE